MKKIKVLQLLIYIAFGLLIVHDVLPGFTRGFMDGFHDGFNQAHGNKPTRDAMPAVLNGDILMPLTGRLKPNDDYSLQHIFIEADVVLTDKVKPNVLLTSTNVILVFGIAVLLILIAVNINRVIVSIANGEMFGSKCIRYLRFTGVFLLIYPIVIFVYNIINLIILLHIVHFPLEVCNTSSFNFEVLICAILAFILAEAFKYGAQLKQEQELTI